MGEAAAVVKESPTRQTVLLVEDDDQLRSMLGDALRRNYDVIESVDGTAALLELDAGPTVDLVVTDLEMPNTNGIELMRRLPARLPVIVMSGFLETYGDSLQTVHPAAVIRKPFGLDELGREIKSALESAGEPDKEVARQKQRVLVVDDDEMVRSAVSKMLETFGYYVATAMDGEEAVLEFARDPFDLVITDFFMARMSGLEVIDALRRIDPGVKVLIMSGVDTENVPESDEIPSRAPADGLIDKPFGVSDLLSAVRAVLPD